MKGKHSKAILIDIFRRFKFCICEKKSTFLPIFYLILLKNEPQIGQRPIKGDFLFNFFEK